MHISNSSIEIVNKQFYNFTQKTLKNSQPKFEQIKIDLQKHELNYKNLGLLNLFVKQTQKFAEDCLNQGLSDITGIIYSILIKIQSLSDGLKETLIKRAIEISQLQGDPIHELARTAELKQLYYKNFNTRNKDYIKVLMNEENILKNILNNYEECKNNYRTISKQMPDINVYKYNIALAKMNIAKVIFKNNKKLAYKKLKEARKFFVELNKTKELKIVEQLIYKIES